VNLILQAAVGELQLLDVSLAKLTGSRELQAHQSECHQPDDSDDHQKRQIVMALGHGDREFVPTQTDDQHRAEAPEPTSKLFHF
jgi:hypothetical protein